MVALPNRHKIKTDHLARQALIYVRQSSLRQIRQHTASTARQYDLAQQAQQLGWSQAQIVIIDQDQGCSGASAKGRDGFQQLVATVGLGQAGAVFSLEASRLARSSSDWYRLLELCSLSHTLVIDEEGIYDPTQYDDRLGLGVKGTLSEAELHWLRARLLGGKLEKARQGKLRQRPPIGYLYDAHGQLGFDPDEEIRQAVQLLFDLFQTLGSNLAVAKHFTQQQLLFPTRLWTGPHKGQVGWRPLKSSRVLDLLHNPFYAGTYVYGRSRTQRLLGPGQTLQLKTQTLKREEWSIVIPKAHPAYISWPQYLRNQQRLAANQAQRGGSQPGPAREGTALLQGIVLCGRCGRRMTSRYQEDKLRPAYHCDYGYKAYGQPRCQSIRGHKIDAAVEQAFLEAVEPAQLKVAMAALEHLEAQAQQVEKQWQRRLERAGYEAELAQRRFMQVEPENRLVARTLEGDWNDKLAELQRLERAYAGRPQAPPEVVSLQERAQVLALAQDLPRLWQAPTTKPADRKRLLRCLIKDITLTGEETTIHIGIRWQSEALSELTIARSTQRTAPKIIAQIRALAAAGQSDDQIASRLNQAGWTTARSLAFSAARVKDLRKLYSIANGVSKRPDGYPAGQRADGRVSTRAAAQKLNRPISTVLQWCRQGKLDADQDKPGAPYWIKLTPQVLAQYSQAQPKPAQPEQPDG